MKKMTQRGLTRILIGATAAILFAGPLFFFGAGLSAQNAIPSPQQIEESAMTQEKGTLDSASLNADDPVAECEAAIRENGLFKEALDILRPWTLRPEIAADSLPDGVELTVNCLDRLDKTDELDDYIEAVIAAHPDNVPVLVMCASLYQKTVHRGAIRDGRFVRGARSGRIVFTAERDRVRSLQLWGKAAKIFEAAPTEKKAAPAELFDFYRDYAEAFGTNRPEWRRQILTDLTTLPEPDEIGQYDRSITYAPVDAEGNPVFFAVPESFETAKNDGERQRFLLQKAAESCPERALEIDWELAQRLQTVFGVQTLREYRFFFRDAANASAEEPAADGVWSLASLADDETIARLATGVKRFKLPLEQNYLKFYEKVYENGDEAQKYQARLALGSEYQNRRQYVKAAEYFKALIPYEAKKKKRAQTATHSYHQITGNWGAFDPVESKAAGGETSLVWKFRNASSVSFTVHEVNVSLLLADIKAYIQRFEGKSLKKFDHDKIEPEQIGFRLMNEDAAKGKYLGEKRAEWTTALSPAQGHGTKKLEIPFPVADAGAYLVTAQTADGNSDAIVVWINDTALVKKPIDGANLWYVADAATGFPVPNAKLDFFGYSVYQKKGLLGGRGTATLKTTENQDETDTNGLCVQKQFRTESDDESWQWLITASGPDSKGHDRLAFFGFNRFWYSDRSDERYQNDRAYFISDRPVYRPGDKIEYKFWVGRAEYDLPETWSFAGKTVWLTITDPTETETLDKKITLDETGGFADALETTSDAKLGAYSFMIKKSKEGEWLGSGTLRIEEYKKPEYEVTVDSPADPVRLGETFRAKISAKYYFGSPVTSAKVKYTVTRTKKTERWFPDRPWDWFYGNGYGWLTPDADWYPGWKTWGIPGPIPPWRPWNRTVPEVVAQNEVAIGPDGTVEVEIDSSLAAAIFPGANQEYKIEAEVVDQSRRTITGSGTVQVAAKPFQIYCWMNRGFLEPGQQTTATVQARRIDGKPVAGNAAVKIYRVTYEPDEKGTVMPVETEVGSQELTLDASGVGQWPFVAGDAGQYRVAVTMKDTAEHEVIGGTLLSVRGSGDAPENAFRNAPLEIVPEKAEYVAGETVRLSLNTQSAGGTILLFLRSVNGTCSKPEIIQPNGTQATFAFPLTDADAPNIFVEALTVLDGRFYECQREIPVVPEKRVVNVEIVPSARNYKPGEKASAQIRLTDIHGQPVAGEMVVAVYDRSVEYISGGSNVPDVKSVFWDWKRSSSPEHEDNLENVSASIYWQSKAEMRSLGLFDDSNGGGIGGGFGGVRMMRKGMGTRNAGPMMAGAPMMVMEDADSNAADGMAMEAAAAPMMEQSVTAIKNEEIVSYSVRKDADSDADSENGAGGATPTIRENFADTALWVGRLTADKDGCAQIALDMPENLTTWKIRVWSFAPGTRVGEGTTEIITRKDLILRMQRPRFLAQTDTVTLSANVHNYLDNEKKVTVSLEIAPGDDSAVSETNVSPLDFVKGDAVQVVTIPSQGEARFDWSVKASRIGDARLVMKAVTDEESDAMAETLHVQIHGMKKQEAASGMITANAKDEGEEFASSSVTMTVPAARLTDQTLLTVRFSPTLAGSMIDALPYLADYPYGCTEQTLNRFLPTVLTRKALQKSGVDLASLSRAHANLNAQQLGNGRERLEKRFDKNPIYDEAEVERMTAFGVGRLLEMQCADGGWGWFSGYREQSTPYLTALVTKGLYLARQADVAVDSDALERGITWLENYLADETRKLLNGETWTDEQKEKYPDRWKISADATDSLVYFVLHEVGRRPGEPAVGDENDAANNAPANLARMKEYLWRDRMNVSLYADALYALALCDEGLEANGERIAMVVRMLRQYLIVDDENQTAYLDIGRAGCWGGAWRWWSWDGNAIETQSAFLRLLVRTETDNALAPRLVKYLLNNRKNGTYWNSTRDTALCLEAFGEYLDKTGEASGAMTVEVLIDGEVKKTCAITPENLFNIDNTLELTELADGEHTVTLRRTGSGPLYWNAYLENFTLEDFIEKTGLEVKIERRYWLLTEDADAATDVAGGRGQAVSQRIRKQKRTPIENLAEVTSGAQVEVELLISSKNDYDSLLIEDHKGAGFEPVDLTSGYNGNELGAYVEFRDDRVSFFVKNLDTGDHTLTYRLRAETPGQFSALPATILGMYAPELAGNSDEMKIGVKDEMEN